MDRQGDETAPFAAVERYYRAIDEHDYEALGHLLVPEFVHRRPDRTLEGRDRFVAFMRDERPRTDTVHELVGWFDAVDGPTGGGDRDDGRSVAVRGRLIDATGTPLFEFVDVHEWISRPVGRLGSIVTYTR